MLISDKPAMVVDDRGFIRYVNEAFEKSFGWNAGDAVGESLSIIIPETLREAHDMGFSRFLSSDEPKILNTALTLKAINRSGREFDAEHYIIAEREEGRWVIGATVVPIG